MKILPFVVESLGNTSYLLVSGRGVAAMIDPLRDADRYAEAAAAAGARITHIFETHVHNDFVSGSRELAAITGAAVYCSAGLPPAFEHVPVREGDEIFVGDVRLRVLATPGHTPEHVSYLAHDPAAPDRPTAIFTGGTLLVGTTGRTDLLGRDQAPALAENLFDSLQKYLALPDDVEVLPTHGAGSFCNATGGSRRTSTIGEERRTNAMLQIRDRAAFVRAALSGLPIIPAWFARMRPINLRGPAVLGGVLRLAELEANAVARQQRGGAIVVDLRPTEAFDAAHIPGAVNIPLESAFGSWIGRVLPADAALILVADGAEAADMVEEAVRQFIRIGYERFAGVVKGGMAVWQAVGGPVTANDTLTSAALAGRLSADLVILDVRELDEWQQGHIPGAVHVPLGSLVDSPPPIDRGRPIAVHCQHHYRSAIGVSLLERHGFERRTHILDGFLGWQEAGLPIAT